MDKQDTSFDGIASNEHLLLQMLFSVILFLNIFMEKI
jgi:hypothetical protein